MVPNDSIPQRTSNLRRIAAAVQLVALDLDGTMLDGRRQLVHANIDAVQRARDAGITVALASGRILPSISPYASQLGLTGPFICANGAHVVDAKGVDIAYRPLAVDVVQEVLQYATDNQLHLNLYSRDRLFFSGESPWGDLYRNRASSLKPIVLAREELDTKQITKLMLIADPDSIQRHNDALRMRLAGMPVSTTESEPEYLEFLAPNVSKGNALIDLASAVGVPIDRTAAIGDYLNDVEMIQVAGLGAAVSSGHPETIGAAQLVVGSNEAGGAAEFLDMILGSRLE